MRKIWDIPGGVHPAENKTQSNHSPITTIALPSQLLIPLNQHIGAPAEAIVEVGERVLKHQQLAKASGFVSAAVHASSSGTVTAIEERPIPHASGLKALCVVIECDGEDQSAELTPLQNWQSIEKPALIDFLRNQGIAGMGGAGFPTAVKMQPRADQHIDTLILNGTECEPYITADDRLMREKADEIVAGMKILAHLLGEPNKKIIGIEDNKAEAFAAVKKAAKGSDIEVVMFPTKYPSGGEKQLIQILTGKEVPSAGIPADIGIVVQNVGTARAVYRAVEHGESLIERVTTVVGQSLGTQQNIWARIGTPVSHILAEHQWQQQDCAQLIFGGPMMGFAMQNQEVPIILTTNCVLAPSREEMPEPEPQQACIRCGLCAEACPASLLPQQLYWYSRSEDFERLQSHNLFDCIECGACSFVCPSNIPLVQYYRASKGAIRHHEQEKQKAEHSRQRFEFRKARLEKAEAEKEAKRLARKKAAEEAKAKAASAPAAAATPTKTTKPAAMEAAAHNDEALAKTQKKLERALSSAESRLERAQKALADAQSEGLEQTRLDSLSARIKDAENKVQDAQKRLQENTASNNNKAASATDSPMPSAEMPSAEELSKNRKKLERALSSAESRLERANKALNDASSEGLEQSRLDTLAARVKDAEAKALEAKQKLDIFESSAKAQAQNDTNAPADNGANKIKNKLNSSSKEKIEQSINTLEKRLATAKQKAADAEASGAATLEALRLGVTKLEEKLELNKKELAELNSSTTSQDSKEALNQETNAADAAIAKAQARAQELAAMSDDEKAKAQLESLKKRLEKARARLTKAEADNDDNIDAFRAGVEKLEAKLENQLAAAQENN
ncbi:electron transport complex subunit RsxC [Agaribacterium haliotis]|uniref:electron transport complex subunit RsxC n=1 Tax=Agaribacterium haliotis TaxID=2013869 RepID=UPI000BB533CE|nr:electron transport complex subunit RsxC [Agaribacterium haliotis]